MEERTLRVVHGLVVVVGPAERRGAYAAAVVAEARARGARSCLVTPRQAPPPRRLPAPLAFVWAGVSLSRYLATDGLRWTRRSGSEVLVADGTWHDVLLRPSAADRDGWLLRASLPLWPFVPRADIALVCGEPLDVDAGDDWRVRVSSQLAPWMAHRSVVTTAGAAPEATARRVLDVLDGAATAPTLAWATLPVAHRRDEARTTVGHASRAAIEVLRPARGGGAIVRVNAALAARRLSPARVAPVDELEALCRSLGVIPDGMASVLLRRAGRRLVSVASGGQLRLFIKVGGVDDHGLRHEARLLAELAGSANGVVVPRLVWQGPWADRWAVVTEPVPRDPPMTSASLSEHALAASLLLAGVGRSPGTAIVHGDLAPWNLLVVGGRPALLDWEEARFDDLPLHDLAHFVVQGARLLRWSSPDGALADLIGRGSLGWRYLDARGIDPRAAPELVLAYLRGAQEQTAFHQAMRARLDR